MGLQLNKKKYSAKEVEALLEAELSSTQQTMREQKDRINELVQVNRQLESELFCLKEKESMIDKALINAESQAQQTIEKSNREYELALLRLKSFSKRWDLYFEQLKEKYPLYPYAKESVELGEKLKKLIGACSAQEIVEELDEQLGEVNGEQPFDAKKAFDGYLATTSENGFNLQEVLNPGRLELEDICKELGLLDEE